MKIRIVRGGSSTPVHLLCGDAYDSTLQVTDDEFNQKAMFNHVSTIPSRNLFGKDQLKLHGILAPLTCAGIWFHGSNIGWGFKLFDESKWDQINVASDVTEDMRKFNSVKDNPSMNNEKKLSDPCIHCGGMLSNQSEGCMTIYYPDFADFAAMWKENDKVHFELVDDPMYKYPEVA